MTELPKEPWPDKLRQLSDEIRLETGDWFVDTVERLLEGGEFRPVAGWDVLVNNWYLNPDDDSTIRVGAYINVPQHHQADIGRLGLQLFDPNEVISIQYNIQVYGGEEGFEEVSGMKRPNGELDSYELESSDGITGLRVLCKLLEKFSSADRILPQPDGYCVVRDGRIYPEEDADVELMAKHRELRASGSESTSFPEDMPEEERAVLRTLRSYCEEIVALSPDYTFDSGDTILHEGHHARLVVSSPEASFNSVHVYDAGCANKCYIAVTETRIEDGLAIQSVRGLEIDPAGNTMLINREKVFSYNPKADEWVYQPTEEEQPYFEKLNSQDKFERNRANFALRWGLTSASRNDGGTSRSDLEREHGKAFLADLIEFEELLRPMVTELTN